MGDVYLALAGRPGFEKPCVIKRITPETLPSEEHVKRFRREAEISRTLTHPLIAQTIAVDEFEGEPFLVQEFVEGRTLTQLVAAARSADVGVVPAEIALHIVREIARALAYAHAAGVVHRDVAPDNVMVTFGGGVRLIDFGIARGLSDATLTQPGMIVGRWSYTAPEVLGGARADHRADVYAAGVVLWELLTGRAPAFAEREKPPAPSSLRSDLPPALDAVVLQALAADPNERIASAELLQAAIEAHLPPSFEGDAALTAFMARCYDVDVLRRRFADEMAEAKVLRAQEDATDEPLPEIARSSRGKYFLAAAGVLLAAGIGYAIVRPSDVPSRASPLVGQTQPPSAPPVAAVTPKENPPPAQASPAVSIPATVAAPRPAVAPGAARTPVARSVLAPRRAGPAISAGILLDRARDSLRAGDLASAERDARAALDGAGAPQKASAHLIIGKVLVLRGQERDAATEFSAALDLDPGNEAASAALSRLRKKP
jgi:serine/threonine-protein kinase